MVAAGLDRLLRGRLGFDGVVVSGDLPRMRAAVLARNRSDPAFRERVDDGVRTALLPQAHAGLLTR